MSDLSHFLSKALADNHFSVTVDQQHQLIRYLELLHHWNQKMNLTAVRDLHESVMQHIIDSLSITPYLNGKQLIDVGSGAGLPGIPLAITQLDKLFTLLDSNGKKTRFLTQAVIELGLKNVTIVHARVEQFFPEQKFDAVITRAFSSLADMIQQTKQLLKPNGEWLAMKGVYPEAEIKALPSTVHVIEVVKLTLMGLNKERCLVRVKIREV